MKIVTYEPGIMQLQLMGDRVGRCHQFRPLMKSALVI